MIPQLPAPNFLSGRQVYDEEGRKGKERFPLIDCALNGWQARVKSTSLMRENAAKLNRSEEKRNVTCGHNMRNKGKPKTNAKNKSFPIVIALLTVCCC